MKKNKKQILRILGIFLGAAILIFIVREFLKNWQDIVPYLKNMNVGLFACAAVIYGLAFLATGCNWAYILHTMDDRLGIAGYLNIHMVSALARYIPGGIWNIVGKAYLCTEKKVEKSATTASMILEYVFQIISSGLFFLFFIPVLAGDLLSPLMTAGILAAAAAALWLLPWAAGFGVRFLGRIFKEDLSGLRLRKSFVYQVLFRYMAVWLLTGMGLVVLVMSFSQIEPVQGLYLVLSYPVSWVAGFLSPSPNGMGVREGVLGMLLGKSYQYELLLLITLTTRIWTMLGEAVAFFGFQVYYKIKGHGIPENKLTNKGKQGKESG